MNDIFDSLKNFKFNIDKSELIEQKELYSMEAMKRNLTLIECNHCGVVGNEPNMLRWHFQNCETIFRNCEQCGNIIPRQGIKPFLYNVKKYCNRKCYMDSKKGKVPIIMTDEIKQKLTDKALSQSKERSERVKKTKPWIVRWKKDQI